MRDLQIYEYILHQRVFLNKGLSFAVAQLLSGNRKFFRHTVFYSNVHSSKEKLNNYINSFRAKRFIIIAIRTVPSLLRVATTKVRFLGI